MLIWIEIGVAAAVMLVLFASTFLFKPEHMAPQASDVRVGAALQGAILGTLIGFVLVPLRMALFGGAGGGISLPPPNVAVAILPILLFTIAVRAGLLARAPVIGRYLRAYRRASIRWRIAQSEKVLARIDAIEERARS